MTLSWGLLLFAHSCVRILASRLLGSSRQASRASASRDADPGPGLSRRYCIFSTRVEPRRLARCAKFSHKMPSDPQRGFRLMMKLYWSPRSRSFSALWLMEETGQPYERVLTDISTGAQRTLEFLAVNPMGKVPALQAGGATLAEAAAICAFVAEGYPEAKLGPPLG